MSEPAIQVRRKGKGTQVWSIEKLENKLVDMREHYADWKEDSEEMVGKQEDHKQEYYSDAPVFGLVCSTRLTENPAAAATRSTKRRRTTT